MLCVYNTDLLYGRRTAHTPTAQGELYVAGREVRHSRSIIGALTSTASGGVQGHLPCSVSICIQLSRDEPGPRVETGCAAQDLNESEKVLLSLNLPVFI